MNLINPFLIVGAGGFLGAIARYSVGLWVKQNIPVGFPLGTFLVNFVGCFAIGLFFEISKAYAWWSSVALFFVVGFLGAFTTFSAFGLETIDLLRRGQTLTAFGNVSLNVLLCLLAVQVGFWLGQVLPHR